MLNLLSFQLVRHFLVSLWIVLRFLIVALGHCLKIALVALVFGIVGSLRVLGNLQVKEKKKSIPICATQEQIRFQIISDQIPKTYLISCV